VTNTIPFYRAAFQGANLHFWTSDANEYFNTGGKHLPTGYLGEGIACYIFPASGAQFSGVTAAPSASDDEPSAVSVVNGASLVSSGVIAPGQVLTIAGRHLGRTVLLNGKAAHVISANDHEVRVLAPADFSGAAEVSVQVGRTPHATLRVVPADPAIFTSSVVGRGNAQARNEDGEMNRPQHAAARGSLVTLYTTGFNPANLPLDVHIGGYPAEVVATRTAESGVVEVTVRVPESVGGADFQPVVLHVGELFTQPGVGLAIR
jgi:uncharacterized protein (TIGR03437 family)